jgi:hypothetical protein
MEPLEQLAYLEQQAPLEPRGLQASTVQQAQLE